eukprot:gene77-393_t
MSVDAEAGGYSHDDLVMARKAQQTVERSMVLGGIGSQMLLRSNYGAALDAEADAEAGASIAVFDNRDTWRQKRANGTVASVRLRLEQPSAVEPVYSDSRRLSRGASGALFVSAPSAGWAASGPGFIPMSEVQTQASMRFAGGDYGYLRETQPSRVSFGMQAGSSFIDGHSQRVLSGGSGPRTIRKRFLH